MVMRNLLLGVALCRLNCLSYELVMCALRPWRTGSSPIGDHDEKITDVHGAVVIDVSRAACRWSSACAPPAHHSKQVTHIDESILGDVAQGARRSPPAPIGHGSIGMLDSAVGDQFAVVNPYARG